MSDDLILDGTKIAHYADRVSAWERGERIAPITIDLSLLPRSKCNFNCGYCYATLQNNEEKKQIDWPIIRDFLDDCADIGVRGISFVSDGESSHSPVFAPAIKYGSELGLSMASGTNAFTIKRKMAEEILPHLTYLRVNISAAEPKRFGEIMGTKAEWFHRVVQNIKDMVEIKLRDGLPVTIGMQMVVQDKYADQIIPLAKLAIELGVCYLVLKHCSDDEFHSLGVNYDGYEAIYDLLREAESLSTNQTRVVAKWSKIKEKGKRSYQRCYGPPFLLQLSGTGLVAPCGMLFNDRYKKDFHIGNIVETRFKELWQSDRYWEVMHLLASPAFNAQKMCGSLCLQHKVNEVLDKHVKGTVPFEPETAPLPAHGAFI